MYDYLPLRDNCGKFLSVKVREFYKKLENLLECLRKVPTPFNLQESQASLTVDPKADICSMQENKKDCSVYVCLNAILLVSGDSTSIRSD